MFTGIVETVGRVADVDETPEGRRIRVRAPGIASDLSPGQSVAVDGACLTVEDADATEFTLFLATETLDRTTLGNRVGDDSVNLERAMPSQGRFDGHLVQGHVDTTTTVLDREQVGEDSVVSFAIPSAYDEYIVEKGSIALDGISLTIADRDADRFQVSIIPTTWADTSLSERGVGDAVNVEIDMIAKYVASMLADRPDVG